MRITYQDGTEDTIRLLGVDTPEIYSKPDPSEWESIPNTNAGRQHLREWGEKASDYARSRLEKGETVRIVVDETADRRGSFDRLLVYLYDDGELFNLNLLEQGYARFYESSFSKRSQFANAEANAQSNNVGVWDYTEPTATPTSPPSPSPTSTSTPSGESDLSIVEIHADAAGDDNENENDEYIVFKNTGDSTLDLSGWRIEDEVGHDYVFPDGFTLGPGGEVTLHTGSGEDTESHLYWGSGAAIWNNGGDTIFVYDDSGTLVIEHEYE